MVTTLAKSLTEANAHKVRLIDIVRRESFFQGREIRLASGRTSNFYFNMKPTMLAPEGAALIADLMMDVLRGEDVDFVGGLAVGAIPLITNVCLASARERQPIPGFFVRRQAKNHGTEVKIEGVADIGVLAGKTAVILDDVTTTGGGLRRAQGDHRGRPARGCARQLAPARPRLGFPTDAPRFHRLENLLPTCTLAPDCTFRTSDNFLGSLTAP